MSQPLDHEAPLEAWLTQGEAWLDALLAVGLASAGTAIRAQGAALQAQALLLGWQRAAHRIAEILDDALEPRQRSRAVLDLLAWLATARRIAPLD